MSVSRGRRNVAVRSRVFVSSSAVDSDVASVIKEELKKAKIAFSDVSSIKPTFSYAVTVQKAIRTSDALVAIRPATPSTWVETEIELARKAGVPVIMIDPHSREVRVEPLEVKMTSSPAKSSLDIGKLSTALGKTLKADF